MTSDWNDFWLDGKRATQVFSGQKISPNGLNLAEIEAFEDASGRPASVVDFPTVEDQRRAQQVLERLAQRLGEVEERGTCREINH